MFVLTFRLFGEFILPGTEVLLKAIGQTQTVDRSILAFREHLGSFGLGNLHVAGACALPWHQQFFRPPVHPNEALAIQKIALFPRREVRPVNTARPLMASIKGDRHGIGVQDACTRSQTPSWKACIYLVWLPGMDSNHDSRLQRPLSYH
jgi:hypothetical protein